MKAFDLPLLRRLRALRRRHPAPRRLASYQHLADQEKALIQETSVLALVNNKGGVGKTTLAVNLAAALAMRTRVLLVDVDSQGSATRALGQHTAEDFLPTLAHVLDGEVPFREAIRSTHVNALDYVAGGRSLSMAAERVLTGSNPNHRLQQALAAVRDDYGFIILDCAPSFDVLMRNALVAADGFFIPLQPHFLAIEGMKNLLGMLREAGNNGLSMAPLWGIILSMVDEREERILDMVGRIRRTYGDLVLPTMIPYQVELAEAPASGKSIFEFSAPSRAARRYWKLSKEVLRRCQDGQELALLASL